MLPTLYKKARTGKLHSWRIWSEGSMVYTEHGTLDGQKQIDSYEAQPSNVGRSNERNGEEQAAFEAESKWKKKLDEGYSDTEEKAGETVFLPMLAHPMEKRKKELFGGDKHCAEENFIPCDVQPKLDGVRCMAYNDNGQIVLMSRKGKPWDYVPHINGELSWLPVGDCVDGELYAHGQSFQTITSWCKGQKKASHPESGNVEFHIYDYPVVADDGDWGSWEERRDKLGSIQESAHVKVVPSLACEAFEDIAANHQKFCSEGFEGAIVRTRVGRYTLGHRSPSLLKVKSFLDEEYEVVGAEEGKGREEGCVIWVCRDNASDKLFKVRPEGSQGERRQIYQERGKYVGGMLRVKFFEKTDDGIPRFPVGLGFRDPRD